jgi:hypothetical protein
MVARRPSDAAEGSGLSVFGADDVQAAAVKAVPTTPMENRTFLDGEILEDEVIAHQSIASVYGAQEKSKESLLYYAKSDCRRFTKWGRG